MREKPLEDWEYPEPDVEDDGDDETPTITCPYCRQQIYEDVEFCPNCAADIGSLRSTAFFGRPIWYILLVVFGFIAFLLVFVLP